LSIHNKKYHPPAATARRNAAASGAHCQILVQLHHVNYNRELRGRDRFAARK
jgi:hypothetical protein